MTFLSGEPLVAKSLEIARIAHAGQFRDDKTTPYIDHPLDVARRFVETWTRDTPIVNRLIHANDRYRGEAIAVAHDIVEDTSFTFDQLEEEGLGSIIPELRLLTHDKDLSYLDYILRLKRSCNLLAITVKLCDMSANEADLANIPSAGRRKAMKTKYELARYILVS